MVAGCVHGFRVIGTDTARLERKTFIAFVTFVDKPDEGVILPAFFKSFDNSRGMGMVEDLGVFLG